MLRRLAMALVTFVAAIADAKADNGPDVYDHLSPGVLLIRASSEGADQIVQGETGTGFVISSDGYVLTASHVIPEVLEEHLSISGTAGPKTATAHPMALKLVKRSEQYDAALLRIVDPPRAAHVLNLRTAHAHPGESLFVLGYPFALPDTHILNGIVGDADDSDITINVLVDKGNSGGPVLDANGCVVGIVYRGIERLEGEAAHGLKFAVPVTSLTDLIPAQLNKSAIDQSVDQSDDIIHVTDTLHRTQTIHDAIIDTLESYKDSIPARPGYQIQKVEAVGKNSLNPPKLDFPEPVISNDRRSILLSYSLLSGPFFDQRRGWIEMTISTEQKRIGSSPAPAPLPDCN